MARVNIEAIFREDSEAWRSFFALLPAVSGVKKSITTIWLVIARACQDETFEDLDVSWATVTRYLNKCQKKPGHFTDDAIRRIFILLKVDKPEEHHAYPALTFTLQNDEDESKRPELFRKRYAKPPRHLSTAGIPDSLDQQKTANLSPEEEAIRSYLEAFVGKMEAKVEQAMSLSAQDSPEAIKRKVSRHDMDDSPASLAIERSVIYQEESDGVVEKFDSFKEAFDAHEGRALLLGEPGAGKTTTLRQLAAEKARRCLEALNQNGATDLPPIPLLHYIRHWQQQGAERFNPARQRTIPEWIRSELKSDRVTFPEEVWQKRTFLYLLDGLDELGSGQRDFRDGQEGDPQDDPRLVFLTAAQEQLPDDAPMAISCRVQDYREIGDKTTLTGAATLLPLTPEKIEKFLTERNQGRLWEIASKDSDKDSELIEILRTPLLLGLFSVAVGENANKLPPDFSVRTANDIFKFYIEQRLEHESVKRVVLEFDEPETRRRLGALAAAMWRFPWNSAANLTVKEVAAVLGEDGEEFIPFACRLNFLRREGESVSFIHLRFRDYCAVPALNNVLNDPNVDIDVRRSAAYALGKIGGAEAVTALINVLNDPNVDKDVRGRAAWALGEIGSAEAVTALINVLNDPNVDQYVRWSAADALGEIGGAEAVTALTNVLKDSNVDQYVRWSAADALERLRKRKEQDGA